MGADHAAAAVSAAATAVAEIAAVSSSSASCTAAGEDPCLGVVAGPLGAVEAAVGAESFEDLGPWDLPTPVGGPKNPFAGSLDP